MTARLHEITNAESAIIQFRSDIQDIPDLLIDIGIDPDYMKQYSDHFFQCDMWINDVVQKKVQVGEIYTDEGLSRQQTFKRSEFYNDLLCPLHLFHLLTGLLEINTGRLGCLSAIGSSKCNAFTLEHQQLFHTCVVR